MRTYLQPNDGYNSDAESDLSQYDSCESDIEDEGRIINVIRKDGIGDDEFKSLLNSVLKNPNLEKLVLNFNGTAVRDGSVDYLINKLESLSNSALSSICLSMRDVFITDLAFNKLANHLTDYHGTLLCEIDLSSNNHITSAAINNLLQAVCVNPKVDSIYLENLGLNHDFFICFLDSLQKIEKPRENKLVIEFGQTLESTSYINRIKQEATKHNIEIDCICPPGR